MEWIFAIIILGLAAGAALYFFVIRKKKPAPNPLNPPVVGPDWRFLNSPGMTGLRTRPDGTREFDFPPQDGVHMVVRPHRGERLSSITFRFRIEGNTWFKTSDPADGGTPSVRLFLQRRLDNWSGAGEYEHYRWWSQPTELKNGEIHLVAPITSANWTSVYGRTNSAAFVDMLTNLESVGFSFGGSFAAHGVYGDGRFVLVEYRVD